MRESLDSIFLSKILARVVTMFWQPQTVNEMKMISVDAINFMMPQLPKIRPRNCVA